MPNTVPEQKRTGDRPIAPDPEPRDGGLAVTLWVLAVLIAEIELWSWLFAHIYES
jgi:hypothetical protein